MKNLLTIIATSNKALVPLAVGGVLALLAGLGVTGDMSVKDALTMIFTAVAVWVTPNLKK